jgi:glycosylphosphatidylinositol transamidase (GPIT) subunit GPI8
MAKREVPLIKAKKIPKKDVVLDPSGFFVIEIDRKQSEIRVEYYTNVYKNNKIVSGILKKIFTGTKADALCDNIADKVPRLLPTHYMYLGRELQNAQYALEKNIEYHQGGC